MQSEDEMQQLGEYDQFLIYVNRQTEQIACVEFALRGLLASYKGGIHYIGDRAVQGLRI